MPRGWFWIGATLGCLLAWAVVVKGINWLVTGEW